jgi:protein O-mannosyl-transferase
MGTERIVARLAGRSLPLVVAIVAFVVFSPVLGGGFLNWDDDRSLLTNPAFRGLGLAQLRWMFTTTLLGHYAPLTWLSFGATYAAAGMAPWAYHLGNLALHAANTMLVYLVSRRLLASALEEFLDALSVRIGALLSALLFGLHPLRAESVGWITDRSDVLCAMFYLLAVLGYLRAAGAGAVGWRWRLASLVAFAAALLSKEIALTLPLSLLLLDAYPLRRSQLGWRRLFVEKAPYLLVAAVGAGLAVLARSQGGGWTSMADHDIGARLAMVAYSLAFYPLKFVWPAGLSPLYELPRHVHTLEARFVGAGVLVVGVTAGLILLRRRVPGALVAWLHAAVVVAPVSGLVHAGSQLVADRYSYLAGLGFAALAGGGVARVVQRRRDPEVGVPGRIVAAVTVAFVVVVVLAASSWQQSWRWRDSVSLWRAAVAVDAECLLCQYKLGTALMTAHEPALAEPHLRRALELAPDRVGIHIDLGVDLALLGRDAEAEHEFREALRLAPGSVMARQNLAVLYTRQRQPAAAVAVLREAQQLTPDDPSVLVNLGHALLGEGAPRDAAVVLERAVALAPARPDARLWLARAYLATGEPRQAAPHIAALEGLDPSQAAALRRELP